MSNSSRPAKRRPAPLSLRLSEAERADLTRRAAGVPLGTFVKRIIFEDRSGVKILRRQRYHIKDSDSLGRLLGLLGQSRLASNLNQLAKAANLGALPVSEETEADLRAACADIAVMRYLLLNALGVTKDEIKSGEPSVSGLFAQSAGRPS